MMSPRSGQLWVALSLVALAAAYFAVSCGSTLDWVDEGHLIYQSWRVAQGAVPYRDTMHLYGPGVFLLNGALFWLFGPQLLVIRISLVVLKAVLAVLVYLAARRIASWPFALGAYALFVAVWGAPIWVFNTSYASNYGHTLELAGLLAFLALRSRLAAASLVAGLCFGLAALFKETHGLFVYVGFVISAILVIDREPRVVDRLSRNGFGRIADFLSRVATLAALVVCLCLPLTYLAPRSTWWNFLVLAAPLVALTGWAAWRRFGRPEAVADVAGRMSALWAIGWCAVGFVVPLAACVLWYARAGLLGELIFSLAFGLPQLLDWFTPLPFPNVPILLCASVVLGTLAVVRLVRLAAVRGERRFAVAAAVLAFGLVATALAVVTTTGDGRAMLTSLRAGHWQPYVAALYFFVPPLTVWLSLPIVHVTPLVDGTLDRSVRAPEPLVFLSTTAAMGLLCLYPAADVWHVLKALPVFLPVLAFLLERWYRIGPAPAAGRSRGSLVSAGLLVVLLATFAAPAVLATMRAARDRPSERFERAAGIATGGAKFRSAIALVEALQTSESAEPAERTLLVLSGDQLLYFLSGRTSALDREEFVFYLIGFGLIPDDDARELVPESQVIARLESKRPLIVDYEGSVASKRFGRVYPGVARFLDRHYGPARTLGGYTLRQWTNP